MDNWEEVTVEDVALEVTVGHVGTMAKHYVEKGIPFLRSLNVEPFCLKLDSLKFISSEFHASLKKSALSPGDVVIVRTGKPGACAVIPHSLPVLNCSDLVIIRCSERLLPKFLCYVVNAVGKKHVSAHLVGAVQQHFNVASARTIKFLLPPTCEQEGIVDILGALDDKIDLNRRMNETLEAMARAIFKDWFVDFGPTRAKMEGRAPYLAPEIWDLFPDRLDEEGKPEGWEIGVLADIAKSPSKGVNPAEVAGNTPYIGLEHMPRHSIALSDWGWADNVSSNKAVFEEGDFLFGKLRPYFHKVGVAPVNGICSTDIIVLKPNNQSWSAFVLLCISSEEFVEHAYKTSTGTKMPRTSWSTMSKYKIVLPKKVVAEAFQTILQPFIDAVIAKIHESKTLAQTRDLLLPKLMSGEIRVKDAERVVAGAL